MSSPVLLIEDDPDIRVLVELTLRMSGIEVHSCAKGRLGLEALASKPYGLVILDVMMPDMSGYEVLKLMVERFGQAAPPVALFTARPPDALVKELEGMPVACVLPKPFDPATLAQIVESLIRN